MTVVCRNAGNGESLRSCLQRIDEFCAKGQYIDAIRTVDTLIAEAKCNWLWQRRLETERSRILQCEEVAWRDRFARCVGRQDLPSENSLDEMDSLVSQVPMEMSEALVRDSIKKCLNAARNYIRCSDYEDKLEAYREAVNKFEQVQVDLKSARGDDEDDRFVPVANVVVRSLRDDFSKVLCVDMGLRLKLLDPLCVFSGGQVRLRLRLVRTIACVSPIDWIEFRVDDDTAGNVVRFDCNGDESPLRDFVLPVTPSPSVKAVGYGNVKIRVAFVRKIPDGLDFPVDRVSSPEKKTFDVDYLIRTENPQEEIGNLGYGRNEASGRYFVGREDVVDRIVKCFSPGCRGARMIIYGQHFCGKSSVLGRVKCVLKGMKSEGRDLYKYTDLNAQFFKGTGYREWFLRSLVDDRCGGSSVGKSEEECLDIVRAEGRKIADSGMTWIVGIDEFTKPYTAANDLELSSEERALRKAELKGYLETIRALVDDGAFCLLAVGQEDTESLINEDSLFDAVSRFETIRLSYLHPRNIFSLAMAPIEEGRVRDDVFQDNVLQRIQSLTGGHPLIAQLLLKGVFSALDELRFPFVTMAVLGIAVCRLLERGAYDGLRWSDFEPFYQLRSVKYDKRDVLCFLRDYISCVKEDCWSPRVNLESDARRVELIDLLISRDILEIDELGRIRLRIPLFELWLRKNPRYLRD